MLLETFLLLITALAFFYWYVKTVRWNYWTRLGVFQIEGSLPIADILKKKHITDIKTEEYAKAEGQKVYGSYLLLRPELNIRDPEILKHIFVKDFDAFVDRNPDEVISLTTTLTDQIWSQQLTFLLGDAWKEARSTFSPIFTSGKLKSMKIFIDAVATKLVDSFNKKVAREDGIVDLKDLLGRFTMDTISSCAFGVDTNSFDSSKNRLPFLEHGQNLFTLGTFDTLKFLTLSLPWGGKLLSLLGISVFKEKETLFFYNVVKETLRQRRISGNAGPKRNDLIDLMLNALEAENLKTDENSEDEDQFEKDAKLKKTGKVRHRQEVDEMEIVANAFVILVAGYDTTSQALAYACYELAKNVDVQHRLQAEVDEAYESSENVNIDYSTIQTLPYLDMVLHETLRLHPALGVLERVCTKDNYKVPGTDIILKKQDVVLIPVYGIHTDPKIYPDPMKFDPQRFSKEEKSKRSPYAFMGFGQGPRSCLGMRFALLEAKIGLAAIIRNFELKVCDKTVDNIKLDPRSVLSANLGGLWVRAEQRLKN